MKRFLMLLLVVFVLVAVHSVDEIAARRDAPGSAFQESPRLEVVLVQHVIDLLRKNSAGDRSRINKTKEKLLEEAALKKIRERIDKRLGQGDELTRAQRFDELLDEMDETFGDSKKATIDHWIEMTRINENQNSNSSTQRAPWPLCVISGCS